MQRKLATWAVTDPSLRIQRLLRLITQPEWLAEAARITLSSKGAHTPGVDGVNKTMLQTTGYPRVAGSYCSAGHADGDGADMGE